MRDANEEACGRLTATLSRHRHFFNRYLFLCCIIITSSVAAGFGRTRYAPPASNPHLCRLTLKLVCESHLRWGTFLQNLDTLGLWVLGLFAIYATDGQTDGRTKTTLIAPFPTVGHNKYLRACRYPCTVMYSLRSVSIRSLWRQRKTKPKVK